MQAKDACDDEKKENFADLTTQMNAMSIPNVELSEQLLHEFDPSNVETMQSIQNDLDETMQTMKKLALRRTVYNDVFRPVHLICPKYSYRLRLDDHDDNGEND